MFLETITGFLSYYSVLETVCLALAALTVVLSLVVAFTYNKPLLRNIVVFIINLIGLFINVKLSTDEIGYTAFNYIVPVYSCGLYTTFIFFALYTIIDVRRAISEEKGLHNNQ